MQRLVEQFVMQKQAEKQEQHQNTRVQRVACLLDGYLSEVSRDARLEPPPGQVPGPRESLPEPVRAYHDGQWREGRWLSRRPSA